MRSAPGLPFLLQPGMEVAFVPPRYDVPRRSRVLSVHDEDNDTYLVHFEGIETLDDARSLVGCSVLARREEVPQTAATMSTHDLIGFSIHDGHQDFYATVEDVIDYPAQRLLSVVPDQGKTVDGRVTSDGATCDNAEESASVDTDHRVLIPFVDAFIMSIDDEARILEMDLPKGLLDL